MAIIKIGQQNLLNKGEYVSRYELLRETLDDSYDLIAFQEVVDPSLLRSVLEDLGYSYFNCQVSFSKEMHGLPVDNYIAVASRTPLEPMAAPLESPDTSIMGVETTIDGQRVVLITCHLAWGGEREIVRMEQVQAMDAAAKANREIDSRSIVVLAGDFNSDEDTRTMRFLRGRDFSLDNSTSTFWTDAWECVGRNPENWATTLHGTSPLGQATAIGAGVKDVKWLPNRRIDYILVQGWVYGKAGCPVNFGYITPPDGREVSDHWGIWAQLSTYGD